MIVGVVFKGNFDSKVYYYHSGAFSPKPLDKVLVPCGKFGHVEVATVVSVLSHLVRDNYDVPKYLKDIIGIADYEQIKMQMEKNLTEVRQTYEKLLEKVR